MSEGSHESRFVTVRGQQFIAPDGTPLLLKGIGIGNWLLPEGYMWGLKRANSPRLIDEVICHLVGEEQARAFWQTYYERFMSQEDIRFLKQADFNHIRISFNWRLFVTDAEPRQFDGVGYACLDRIVDWCDWPRSVMLAFTALILLPVATFYRPKNQEQG